MPTYGLTAQGLKIKRLADVKDELENDFRGTYGAGVDVDARRPIGQFIGIFSERESLFWELLQQIYLQRYPDYAEGVQFDEVAKFANLTRLGATYSQVAVRAFGTLATIIPAGSFISVEGNAEARFATDAEITIGAGQNSVQRVSFASLPSSGAFTLVYDGTATGSITGATVDAAAIKAALEALADIDEVTVTDATLDAGSALAFDIEFIGDNAESAQPLLEIGANTLAAQTKYRVTTVADVAGSLNNKYFIFAYGNNLTAGVWFNVSGAGVVPAGALAQDTQIEVAISTGATAGAVATALRAALAAQTLIVDSAAVENTNEVAFSIVEEIEVSDIQAANTGFTVEVDQVGEDVGDLVPAITEEQEGLSPYGDGTATAVEAGEVQAPAGSLTVIETTVSGWDTVTNPTDAEVGREIETTAEFKLRRKEEIGSTGRATKNAIKAALLQVEDVEDAVVYSNRTLVTDGDGVPGKSVRAVVLGGSNQDIGETLFDSVAAGIGFFGSQTVNVIDDDGFTQPVAFDLASEIDIYVEVDLLVTTAFPQNGVALVRAAILGYGESLTMGDSVIVFPYLIGSFGSVAGITGVTIRIGTAANPTLDDNITIAADEIARFDSGRIEINTTIV